MLWFVLKLNIWIKSSHNTFRRKQDCYTALQTALSHCLSSHQCITRKSLQELLNWIHIYAIILAGTTTSNKVLKSRKLKHLSISSWSHYAKLTETIPKSRRLLHSALHLWTVGPDPSVPGDQRLGSVVRAKLRSRQVHSKNVGEEVRQIPWNTDHYQWLRYRMRLN